jgi:hypothetical protein
MRRPTQQGRSLCGHHRFKGHFGAEMHRLSIVDHHKDRTFAFLTKDFQVGFVGSSGHPPIHQPHIVTGLITPRFFKINASAFEWGSLAAGQQGMGTGLTANSQVSNVMPRLDEIVQFYPDSPDLHGLL